MPGSKKPVEDQMPKRLSLTDTGKVAPKWVSVLQYYPMLDNYLDALYDEGINPNGGPLTTDKPDRLEKLYQALTEAYGTLTRYAKDSDRAVQNWATEILKFYNEQIVPAYSIKHKYLTKKEENSKAKIPEEKQKYEKAIKDLPVEEGKIDKNLETLKRIKKL